MSRQLRPWSTLRLVPDTFAPRVWQEWLQMPGSLTQALIDRAGGDFSVRVQALAWHRPHVDESRLLSQPRQRSALIREVELLGRGQVWVAARSIIPAATLKGAERRLKDLGTTPLGAYLFRCRSMRRSPMQFASFVSEEIGIFYGRRSIFYLHDKPLLVTEYFMPALLQSRVPPKLSTTGQ